MTSTDTSYRKPLPVTDALTEPYWQAANEGRLILQRCTACQRFQHYPRPHCVHCGTTDLEWAQASGRGSVHTFTVIHRNDAPGFADELPYVFAILQLDEGVRMAGNIFNVDPAEVRIGMPVRVCFDRATPELAIPQWQPAQAEAGQ
ncbi:MAG: Zn-ribbon domain-containing OB-fold protein [Streptosporangiales bacterium]